MTTRKWLITGGCGFIGRNLIRKLLENGDASLRILDNLAVGTAEDLADVTAFRTTTTVPAEMEDAGVELVVGDILDEQCVRDATRGADVVVHLAANTGVGPSVADPRSDCVTNVIGTLNCLEAARLSGVKRFIFASSGAPVGECEPPIHEELAPHPVSPYGASKLAGEGYCSAYYRTFGLETVALRFGNVYGPLSSNKGSVVAKFIREAKAGLAWDVYGDGSQTRDFIYVGDLVRAIGLAATAPSVGGEIFQIATNRETTIVELVDTLRDILVQLNCGPRDVRFVERRIGDVLRNYSDTSKARRTLGWSPEMELSEGLRQTVAWFSQRQQDFGSPRKKHAA